ncbi:twitch domain-containing radical SAM protein [Teredinibacter turnerae]|uniref:twitch domain-containing radical SAM protein n=1 Tax=Teredinibacter turnerae TaxID=2426 RepID=UPI0030D5FC46
MSTTLIETKELLDEVSPTMCVAKWKQVTLHLHNGHTHSCHHPQVHPIPLESLSDRYDALHNTPQKINARLQMLNGERPSECQYCWNVEDLKGFSEGNLFSDRVIKSSDSWANQYIHSFSKDKIVDKVDPSYVEVSFSNHCNMKCSYCSPVYSSRWVEEIKTHGPYPTSANFGDLQYFEESGELPIHHSKYNPFVEAFWRWWPTLIDGLKVLRVTGGEPLLSKDSFEILNQLKVNPQPFLELGINTNGSIPFELFDKFVQNAKSLLEDKKIKSLTIYTSVDGWEETAEYSRFGLDFSLWQKNIEHILREIPSATVVVMSTTNVFSVTRYKRLLEYIYTLKSRYLNENRWIPIAIDIAILRHPHHLNLSVLSPEYHDAFDASLDYMQQNSIEMGSQAGFYDFEINKLKRLIEFIKSSPQGDENIDLADSRKDFIRFVDEHDRRRGTSFRRTFPELNSFYDLCSEMIAGE